MPRIHKSSTNRSLCVISTLLSTIMIYVSPLPYLSSTIERKSLICAVFIDISCDKVMSILKHNIRHAQGNCSAWALVPYTPISVTLHKNMVTHTDHLSNIAIACKTEIFYILHDNSTYYEQQGTLTKLDLLKLLLPYLPHYHRVWILDEDISIQQINFNEYFGYLDCQSGPLKNTLISQALVEGPTSYGYLQRESWADHLDYAAAPSLLIEDQSTVLDTNFLIWYISNVIELVTTALGQNADCDWGLDLTWCGAARHYLNNRTNLKLNYEPPNDKYSALYVCAVVMGSSYFTHLDLHSATNYRIHGCYDKSQETVKLFRDLFPSYFLEVGTEMDRNTLLSNLSLRISPSQFSNCNNRE